MRAYLKEKDSTLPNVARFMAQYRSVCEDTILQDFKFSASNDLESRLWDSHGKVNNIFRKELKHFKDTPGKRKQVEQRKTAKHFLDFIKSSQRFYRGYIQRLVSRFGGIRELEAVAHRLTLSTLSIDEPLQVDGAFGHSILVSCHRTLVRLGDLSRWRETQLVDKDRDWGPAIDYYELARVIYPASGASHNQLAVIALADGNHLRATYHLYRALAVESPHPSAKGNLEIEFKKIDVARVKGILTSDDQAREGQGPGKVLIGWFMRLHARCYKGVDFPDHEELEGEVLRNLVVDLKEHLLKGTLYKFVLINIAAEYFAGVRLKGDTGSVEIVQSFFFLQRLNVTTFFALLQVLLPELERSASEDLQNNDNGSGSARLTAVIRRVLPSLRHYSSWLITNVAILIAQVGDSQLNVQIQELWKIYANALTLLVSTFPVKTLQAPIEYLLEEDEDTLGFKPFDNETTQSRYYSRDTGSQKPRWHDRGVDRHHPNLEMLGRIRDFLTDGMILLSREDVPIKLMGGTFIYVEDGIPPDAAYQEVQSSTPIYREEVTHVDETDFPNVSRSVDGEGSHAASASVAMDLASKRMVDELVDSENADDNGENDLAIEFPQNLMKAGLSGSSSKEMGNDTSYGLIRSSAAREFFGELQDQSVGSPLAVLPSIYKSPFAPQPWETPPGSRRRTAKRVTPTHSQQVSQTKLHFQQQSNLHYIESSISGSAPEPTDSHSTMNGQYLNQPFANATYPVQTNYTTGGGQFMACENDGHSTLENGDFTCSAVDYGCSGSVRGAANVQSPPNGQGA